MRRDVAALDPLSPLANIKSLASLVDASIAGRRFTMVLFAYLVGQRTKENGLRLAIGASPSGVVWLFVREGMILTTVGLAVGLAGMR